MAFTRHVSRTSTNHHMNANLIKSAKVAWLADDGQSTHRDIASRVLSKAVERGELSSRHGLTSALESALVAFSVAIAPEDIHPMEASRRKAESDWQAAVKAARRPVTVYDEDGGTSVDMRVPHGWSHEGCTTLGEYILKTVPGYADAESAKAGEADEAAAQFVASLPSMTTEQAKEAYWSLSNQARLSQCIRALPKAVRRQL